MAETTEKTGEKKLSIATTKTLTLKPRGSETGVVRQSFSHGRTKSVVVEKVRSRTPGQADGQGRARRAGARTKRRRPPASAAAAGNGRGGRRYRLRRRRLRRRSRPAWCCTR